MSDIVKSESQALAQSQPSPTFTSVQIDPKDILIPRLLLAQAMSEVVANDQAKAGDLYRSTNQEILASKGGVTHVIPLSFNKTWMISRKRPGKGRYEFFTSSPYTAENKDMPWFWEDDGYEYKREACLNFFCLLESDIARDAKARTAFAETGELPDVSDVLMPVLLSFRATSYKAGKVLTTHIAMTQDFKVPPYVSSFAVESEAKENEQGKFFVLKVTKAGKVAKEYLPLCERWAAVVNAGSVQIDEASIEQEETVSSTENMF